MNNPSISTTYFMPSTGQMIAVDPRWSEQRQIQHIESQMPRPQPTDPRPQEVAYSPGYGPTQPTARTAHRPVASHTAVAGWFDDNVVRVSTPCYDGGTFVGSGMAVMDGDYILTVPHMIMDSTKAWIKIETNKGKSSFCDVTYRDKLVMILKPRTDTGLPGARVASRPAQVGEAVTFTGFGGRNGEFTGKQGVVKADTFQESYMDFTATPNDGHSGGPVYTKEGLVGLVEAAGMIENGDSGGIGPDHAAIVRALKSVGFPRPAGLSAGRLSPPRQSVSAAPRPTTRRLVPVKRQEQEDQLAQCGPYISGPQVIVPRPPIHIIEKGEKGEKGDPGENGTNGVDGEDGAPGEDGNKGEDGVGVESATVNLDGDLIIVLTDGGEHNAGKVVGPAGENGQDGEDGEDAEPIDDQIGVDGSLGFYYRVVDIDGQEIKGLTWMPISRLGDAPVPENTMTIRKYVRGVETGGTTP